MGILLGITVVFGGPLFVLVATMLDIGVAVASFRCTLPDARKPWAAVSVVVILSMVTLAAIAVASLCAMGDGWLEGRVKPWGFAVIAAIAPWPVLPPLPGGYRIARLIAAVLRWL
ncbi:MAG: hypothetical protein GF331_16515, partial [Chitinivibrionales bacterium]|nr:hypothetical protein [Chitinivibrionales bacterium]